MSFIYVILGGFFGGILRFAISSIANTYLRLNFPIAIFLINFLGSFALGFFVSYGFFYLDYEISSKLIHVGLIGGFTTFSSFSAESYEFLIEKRYFSAIIYILGSFIFSSAGYLYFLKFTL